MIAALFVATGGVYFGLPSVDPWDESRDARLYAGPWAVVAHPPCRTWSVMALCRPEIRIGDDDGCFASALASVRLWGGVLEHPAHSRAWGTFGLTRPTERGWTQAVGDDGWVSSVDQANYGHRARKLTWLYYCGSQPPPTLAWGDGGRREMTVRNDGGGGRDQRSRTPPEFRDVLIAMAESVALRAPRRIE